MYFSSSYFVRVFDADNSKIVSELYLPNEVDRKRPKRIHSQFPHKGGSISCGNIYGAAYHHGIFVILGSRGVEVRDGKGELLFSYMNKSGRYFNQICILPPYWFAGSYGESTIVRGNISEGMQAL